MSGGSLSDDNAFHQALFELADLMKAQGATWARFTLLEDSGELIAEGWTIRPDDEGPLPT